MGKIDLLDIIYQTIQALEMLHATGYVHNDINLDNIMISKLDEGEANSIFKVTLIDFGLSTKYVDPEGNHLEPA